jgi:hypothetical protein
MHPFHCVFLFLSFLFVFEKGLYYSKNKKTDEDFEIMLREKYSRNIENSKVSYIIYSTLGSIERPEQECTV